MGVGMRLYSFTTPITTQGAIGPFACLPSQSLFMPTKEMITTGIA